MSGDLDVPRSTCHHARHLATTAMEEDIRRTQQQSVPPQVPQVGRAGGETGASPSIRRPMLAASVVEAKKDKQGHFAVACPESAQPARGDNVCFVAAYGVATRRRLRWQLAAARGQITDNLGTGTRGHAAAQRWSV